MYDHSFRLEEPAARPQRPTKYYRWRPQPDALLEVIKDRWLPGQQFYKCLVRVISGELDFGTFKVTQGNSIWLRNPYLDLVDRLELSETERLPI